MAVAERDLTVWWRALTERLAGAAVAAASSSPGLGRRHWVGGKIAGAPATPATTFYAASVTKQLLAALVARAVLDGDIDADAGIRTYLPALPTWAAPIRVQHLIHHTAALPQPRELGVVLGHGDEAAGWSQMSNASVLDALSRVTPSSVVPGERHSYDNTGYILLAEILGAVRGREVSDVMRSELFTPLGMTGSRLGGAAPVLLPARVAPPRTVGDGGLWTSSTDLLTWLEAMNADRLGPEVSALVQSVGSLNDGTALDYAWGVGAREDQHGAFYLHGGEWPGWCAMTVRSPTAATAAVILATTEDMGTVSPAAVELHRLLGAIEN